MLLMGFAPDAQGFYAVYEALFEKLARQEETAFERREERGRNNREFQFPARFGDSRCKNLGFKITYRNKGYWFASASNRQKACP